MTLQLASLTNIPTSFASVSIGCKDDHTLPKKIDAIAGAGFQAMELGMPDLASFASELEKKEVGVSDFDELVKAAAEVRKLCEAKNLKILLLQPFPNYEGYAEGSPEREDAWNRAIGMRRIMETANIDTVQVGSTDAPVEKIGTDRSRFVADLQKLADYMGEKGFRVSYENWCWSTHATTWKDIWDICEKVDRPNFGLCLDTFHEPGAVWADPTSESGFIEGKPKADLDAEFTKSMEELSTTVPKEKIFVLQISDAWKVSPPLKNAVNEDGQRPKYQWSSSYRPLPFEGGYLPVIEVTKAVLKTGFRGWFSTEVFDSGPDGKGVDYGLNSYAVAAMNAHKKLLEACSEA